METNLNFTTKNVYLSLILIQITFLAFSWTFTMNLVSTSIVTMGVMSMIVISHKK